MSADIFHMNGFESNDRAIDIAIPTIAIECEATPPLANYLDERNRKHTIRVHEDAIATYDEENRQEYVEAAKLLMKQQGIELVKKRS